MSCTHENEVGVDDLTVTKRYFSGGFVQCSGKHRIDENLNRVSVTDRQTSCHDTVCAMHTRRAVKIAICTYSGLHFCLPLETFLRLLYDV